MYTELHDKIIKGKIPPGSKLVIAQIAKKFHVSEIPVREAIQRLAQEGYITLRPYGAATVNSLSEDEVRQIYEIRSNLESLAAKYAVEHISNAQIKSLAAILEDSKKYLQTEDFDDFSKATVSFMNHYISIAIGRCWQN